LSQTDNILIEKKGCISVLKINTPPQNYLKSPSFISKELLYHIADDQEIKGIIITGIGRHFSAGADLNHLFELAQNPEDLLQAMEAGNTLLDDISALPIPVAAAINGVCMGGGLEIAIACHIRIASAKSIFAFPEINANLIPGLGGIIRMATQSGTFPALSAILSGETFDAQKALEYRVVHQLTEEKVLDYTLAYMNTLVASKPKKVVVSIMQSIHNAYKLPLHEALNEETHMFCALALEEAARRKTP